MSDNPITRKELYLAKLSGQDVEIPEPITREEKYLYAAIMSGGGGGGGATPDFNAAPGEPGHILNKPGGVGYTEIIKTEGVFDGDITGREYVEFGGDGDVIEYLAKVSSTVFAPEDLIGETITTWDAEYGEETLTITEDRLDFQFQEQGLPMFGVQWGGMPIVIVKEDVNLGAVVLTAGVWFTTAPGHYHTKSFSGLPYFEEVVVHKIPEKYIEIKPDPYVVFLEATENEAGELECSVTYMDVVVAILGGKLPVLRVTKPSSDTVNLYTLIGYPASGPVSLTFVLSFGALSKVIYLSIDTSEGFSSNDVYNIGYVTD